MAKAEQLKIWLYQQKKILIVELYRLRLCCMVPLILILRYRKTFRFLTVPPPIPLLRLWVCRANESLSLQLLSEGMKMNQLSHTYSAGNKEQSLTNTDSEGLGSLHKSHATSLTHTHSRSLTHTECRHTAFVSRLCGTLEERASQWKIHRKPLVRINAITSV